MTAVAVTGATVRRAQGRARVHAAGLGRVRARPRHAAGAPPTARGTASSSCRSSRTPGCTRAASASPPTSCRKEMYTFADRGDRSVTLRPEGTAGVVRAVIEHGLDRAGLPVKLRYAGPFFRYERPQAGRYRQLQQVGIEAIGVDDPALDAEVIAVADEGFRALGPHRLPAGAHLAGRRRVPARLPRPLLQRVPGRAAAGRGHPGAGADQPAAGARRQAPRGARAARRRAAAGRPPLARRGRAPRRRCWPHLDDLGVAYVENPRMVRGLDYYTKTTFEFVHDGLGAQSGHRRRRPLRRADGHARRPAAVRRRLRARRRPHAAGLPGRGARALVGGALRGVRRAARRRRAAAAGGARGGAAPGRGAGRPGLRRPGAEGRDEGGRPLRRPLRPGARRARPRRQARSGSRTWSRGSSGRCRSTTSSPSWSRGWRDRTPPSPRRSESDRGGVARRRPGRAGRRRHAAVVRDAATGRCRADGAARTADRARWDARHAAAEDVVPLPPDALRGREDWCRRRAGRSTSPAGGVRWRCGSPGAGWSSTPWTCRRSASPRGAAGRRPAGAVDPPRPRRRAARARRPLRRRRRASGSASPALYPALVASLAPGGLLVVTVLSEVDEEPGAVSGRAGRAVGGLRGARRARPPRGGRGGEPGRAAAHADCGAAAPGSPRRPPPPS